MKIRNAAIAAAAALSLPFVATSVASAWTLEELIECVDPTYINLCSPGAPQEYVTPVEPTPNVYYVPDSNGDWHFVEETSEPPVYSHNGYDPDVYDYSYTPDTSHYDGSVTYSDPGYAVNY